MDSSPPLISIVIPIYNEASLLTSAIGDLEDELRGLALAYEVILAENGSNDTTPELAQELAKQRAQVRLVSSDQPNYGLALRRGIEAARGSYVFCDEIDLLDTGFYRQALELLEAQQADVVVGSKLSPGASDERPWTRHAASILYTSLLRVLVGFRGTDTHGLKAFRRLPMLRVVRSCQIEKDVFSSELLIRAQRSGLRVLEIPTRVREKRPPSIRLYARVPSVCVSLAKLFWSIRIKGGSARG